MQASFRDPEGQVFVLANSVVRAVQPHAADRLTNFFATATGRQVLEKQWLVPTRTITGVQARDQGLKGGEPAEPTTYYEHDKIWFPSFPHEWPPALLFEAGQLTLNLAETLLVAGYGLKDASAYNVMFQRGRPVFIDVLSIQKADEKATTWNPYGQFLRHFVLPLLAWRNHSLPPHELFLAHRDGMEPGEVYRLSSFLTRLRPPVLGLASIPIWLEGLMRGRNGEERTFSPRPAPSREYAEFVLKRIFRGISRSLQKVRPRAHESKWSNYEQNNTYDQAATREKEQFVGEALPAQKSFKVLDVGCNTGVFTCLAARRGASVVSVDYDPVVLDRVWSLAQKEKLDVLPLAVNICRPTPALGWRNGESSAFLERAKGRFDVVLMLAVIHHMLVTERVPLEEILRLASELTTAQVIMEYVPPSDPQFQRIARGNQALYSGLNVDGFEQAARQFFVIHRMQVLGNGRRLYDLHKKS